jgi:hypothetical protein
VKLCLKAEIVKMEELAVTRQQLSVNKLPSSGNMCKNIRTVGSGIYSFVHAEAI